MNYVEEHEQKRIKQEREYGLIRSEYTLENVDEKRKLHIHELTNKFLDQELHDYMDCDCDLEDHIVWHMLNLKFATHQEIAKYLESKGTTWVRNGKIVLDTFLASRIQEVTHE